MDKVLLRCIVGACLIVWLVGCAQSSSAPAGPAVDIPTTLSASGDAAQGKLFFEGNGGCSACHSVGTDKIVGPGLAGVTTSNGPTHTDKVDYKGNLPNGQARTEENMARWIREGGQGQVGSMSAREVSDADMANLLAYLHTLKP